ncbi:MAG: hypothetical protein K2I20_01265 [Clostridia bacterium]|nr:hypothetical protein [Clostridia bacterium]
MKIKKLMLSAAACVLSAGFAFAFAACGDPSGNQGGSDPVKLNAEKASIVVTGYEWGPAVNSVVVKFKEKVSGITKDTFNVTTAGKKRAVTAAYCSDANGKKSDAATEYVTLELERANFTSWGAEASPFSYNRQKQRNEWAAKYAVRVTVAENQSFKAGNTQYKAKDYFSYDVTSSDDRLVPQTATWNKDVYIHEGDIKLSRASWSPEGAAADGVKNPLVIWLHGMGEGGTDIDIDLLGNEVTGLTTDNEVNVQHHFKTGGSAGAYVLAVQSPTWWMDVDGTGDKLNMDGEGEQTSFYTEALYGAITSYVESNDDIDTNRIYLGGCSNGGYMTMNMMFNYGDYFAAYYPICEAYTNSRITDQMIENIKDYNIWFLFSADDPTVAPDKFVRPTYDRLLKAGAQNCNLTVTEHVVGKDSEGTRYDGHWSWIYAFNDDVKTKVDNSKINSVNDIVPANCTVQANMWEWIASKSKS